MKFVPDQSGPGNWTPSNHYTRALYDFKPGQRQAFPGFADEQQYRYTFGIARHGGELPPALAFRTVYAQSWVRTVIKIALLSTGYVFALLWVALALIVFTAWKLIAA